MQMHPVVTDHHAESRSDRPALPLGVVASAVTPRRHDPAPASFSHTPHTSNPYLPFPTGVACHSEEEGREEPNIDAVPSSLLYPQPRPFHSALQPLPSTQLQFHPLLQQPRPRVADLADDLTPRRERAPVRSHLPNRAQSHSSTRTFSRARSPVLRPTTATPSLPDPSIRHSRSASVSAGTGAVEITANPGYTHYALERVKSADRADRACPCPCGVLASSSTVTLARISSLPRRRTPARPTSSGTFNHPPAAILASQSTDLTTDHKPHQPLPSPASPPISTPGLHLSPSEPVTPERSNYFAALYPADYPGYKSPPRSLRGLPVGRKASAGSATTAELHLSLGTDESQEVLAEGLDFYPNGTSKLACSQPGSRKGSMSASQLKRKVVIMGAPSVGKTSLVQQYIAPPTYQEQYYPTIESTSHKTVAFGGEEYDCEIIDSAGQDEYTLFPSKYAVGVHGYILVYSITNRQSFEMIKIVHEKILDFGGTEKVPCVVVGQKVDLDGERRVTRAEGEALAKEVKGIFIESSAKDNTNVGKAFEVLMGEMQKIYNPPPEKKKSGWFSWGR